MNEKLKREHAFITEMWKFMKDKEMYYKDTEGFWMTAQSGASLLATIYYDLPFASDWLASFLKFLEDSHKDDNEEMSQLP